MYLYINRVARCNPGPLSQISVHSSPPSFWKRCLQGGNRYENSSSEAGRCFDICRVCGATTPECWRG